MRNSPFKKSEAENSFRLYDVPNARQRLFRATWCYGTPHRPNDLLKS
jgi:hypothetical protein